MACTEELPLTSTWNSFVAFPVGANATSVELANSPGRFQLISEVPVS
jgi:hypothetical protein